MTRGADAEAQLQARLRERVRTIPGLETRYLIGGYVQVDGLATRRRQIGEEQSTFFPSSIPFGNVEGDLRLSIRQSQFDWLSRTPSPVGPVWTRFEANLFPLDGKTRPTLNQLFVRWDEYFVIGKTYSTFMDDSALPTTLDYNGPAGATFARQWLARGSIALGAGWTLQASVEAAQADWTVEGTSLSANVSSKRPDLALRLRYEGKAGHLQVAGLSRRLTGRVTLTGSAREATREVDGQGVSVSGSLSLRDADQLSLQLVTGKGIGRYFNDPLSATGLALTADGRVDQLRLSGITFYYDLAWTPGWRTVVGASTLWSGNGATQLPDALRRTTYASANLIHRLLPTLAVGGELLWGEAQRVDGSRATNARLQISLRYLVI